MLNNGHVSGMGTPDPINQGPGPSSGTNGSSMYGHPGSSNGPEIPPNSSFLGHGPPCGSGGGGGGGGPSGPGPGNGLMGHHSGGICSQMSLNQSPTCPPNTKLCGGCNGPIMERFLLEFLGRYYHEACLRCSACSVPLADVGQSCYTKNGLVLCKNDYTRMFGGVGGGSCQGCGQRIPPHEYVMKINTTAFHLKCFNCSTCGSALHTGDRYSVINGQLLCEKDALKMIKISNGNPATNASPTPPVPRKGKVGRPRRSRD